jgi:ankyrin repeat protein
MRASTELQADLEAKFSSAIARRDDVLLRETKEEYDVVFRCAVGAGVKAETIAAALHKLRFARLLSKFPLGRTATFSMLCGLLLAHIDSFGKSSMLSRAAETGEIYLMRAALRADVDANLRTPEQGCTALTKAAHGGQDAAVRVLLRAGADIGLPNFDGEAPIFCAAAKGHISTVKLLLAARANAQHEKTWGATPLIAASWKNSSKVVEALLDARASVNHQKNDEVGDTALSLSSWCGNAETVALLLRHGADVGKRNRREIGPLMFGVWRGSAAVVDLLISYRADANERDRDGDTPVFYLCQAKKEDEEEPAESLSKDELQNVQGIIRSLRSAGANVNQQNNRGISALMLAVWYGRNKIVELLQTNKADINAADNDGDTAIFFAARHDRRGASHAKTVEFLLNHGADRHHKNNNGATALDLARDHGFQDLVQVLTSHRVLAPASSLSGRPKRSCTMRS